MGGRPRESAAASRFGRWIDDVGAREISSKLGVTIWAVYAWRRGAESKSGRPRPDPSKLGAILRLAEGRLTAADVFPEEKP